jgi:hypothetical protein
MAIFPELEPATREYTFGTFPLTEEPSASAGIIRFRHATLPAAYQLTLGYTHLTETEADQIRVHYGVQSGGFISFLLPSVIWKGHTFSGNIVPPGMQWRYTAPPEEEHHSNQRYSIVVALESDGQLKSDPDRLIVIIAVGGAGGGGGGLELIATAALSPGTATGGGLASTVIFTLTSGAATGA